ncbi:unnamed protein product [Pieris brassicae]|uniref:Uncharacterized protein n=1 Tax=Pieris brassicae TaxID=7116 RepID=A0A9P0SXW5_PIEBR|nr:unnamed protein product [Pieris brassicae]
MSIEKHVGGMSSYPRDTLGLLAIRRTIITLGGKSNLNIKNTIIVGIGMVYVKRNTFLRSVSGQLSLLGDFSSDVLQSCAWLLKSPEVPPPHPALYRAGTWSEWNE